MNMRLAQASADEVPGVLAGMSDDEVFAEEKVDLSEMDDAALKELFHGYFPLGMPAEASAQRVYHLFGAEAQARGLSLAA